MRKSTLEIQSRLAAATAAISGKRYTEAETICRELVVADPENPRARNLLGIVCKQLGKLPEAIEHLRMSVNLDADSPAGHELLGGALLAAGDVVAAERAYGTAAQLLPESPEAAFNHGVALNRAGQVKAAEQCMRRALQLKPEFPQAWSSLAATLSIQGRSAEAEEAAGRSLSLDANSPDAWVNLGRAQIDLGKPVDAERANRRAVELAPGFPLAWFNLGCALQHQWRNREAAAAFRQAIAVGPGNQQAWSNLLMTELYTPDVTEASIYDESRQWQEALDKTLPVEVYPHATPSVRAADRRLRIGYVSPDFRRHSCASFLQPLIAGHDRAEISVYAYAKVRRADEVTRWFAEHADHWRDIMPLSDQAAAEQVRADRIDILVDLAGHTNESPIGLFRHRPAPVQVSWLGYPATTGLDRIDYRLTDRIADPEGDADRLHSEKLLRLADGFLCYAPRGTAPAIAAGPVVRNRHITFGCFNNLSKVTAPAIDVWARILNSVAHSRLVLKSWMFRAAVTRERIQAEFLRHGIGPERIDFLEWAAPDRYLELYGAIDIALDTFPYNGTTTTFESLWMGVPVVTLSGRRHAARVGASILTHLGRAEWVAADEQQYTAIACRLAEHHDELASIRAGLRNELSASVLSDHAAFAGKIEQTYRQIWHEYLGV